MFWVGKRVMSLSGRRWLGLTFGLVVCVRGGGPVAAHEEVSSEATLDEAPSPTGQSYQPPTLKKFVSPIYPPQARARGEGGTVVLLLGIDAQGQVRTASLKEGLSPSLDAAALSAGRLLQFHPGRLNGEAVSTSLDFQYRFTPPGHTHTEAERHAEAHDKGAHHGHAEVDTHDNPIEKTTNGPTDRGALNVQGADEVVVTVPKEELVAAASAHTVFESELRQRPVLRPSDIFRVAPGVVPIQHAGGGKASQYLLRGFDADHGTDIALSFDGIPLNMVSHGHGQGYADENFVIPELVQRVDITKGPYLAEHGDFSSAGTINLVSRERGESFASFSGGSFDTLRTVAIASPSISDRVHPVFAFEALRTDGPFENPENFTKTNLYGKVTYEIDDQSRLSFGASHYGGDWNASGQLPERAVDAGVVNFFGALDKTEGGNTQRQNLFATYRLRTPDDAEFVASAYLSRYAFGLFSNFTYLSRDPIRGDQIHQRDNRTVVGINLRHGWRKSWHGLTFDTSFGGGSRMDAIENGLDYTTKQERWAEVVDAGIHQSSIGAWAQENIRLTPWLALRLGTRFDHYTFQVDDHLEDLATLGDRTSGRKGAARLSPKASLVWSPHHTTDVFLNFGNGFHSNDARGVVRALDPVTPLTRTTGYELGARVKLFDGRLNSALVLWGMDVASEILWVGDEGVTEAAGATRRLGVEWDGRWQILPWLFADASVTFSHARFRQDTGAGVAVPLAPRWTAAGGVSILHPAGWRGSLRMLHVGARPATEDSFIMAQQSTVVDGFIAHRWRNVELGLNVENLFNQRYRSAQFATVTRLQGEAPTDAPPPNGACPSRTRAATQDNGNFAGCEDLSFAPGIPLSLRLTVTLYF